MRAWSGCRKAGEQIDVADPSGGGQSGRLSGGPWYSAAGNLHPLQPPGTLEICLLRRSNFSSIIGKW